MIEVANTLRKKPTSGWPAWVEPTVQNKGRWNPTQITPRIKLAGERVKLGLQPGQGKAAATDLFAIDQHADDK